MAPETLRLRIRNPANAVLISGQAYQEPKDALNEFVSNAADEYVEAGLRGGRIRVVLRRRGKRPFVAVEDDGRGMDVDRLREVARSLFASRKAGDDRTLGEKAIGILAFQQLGGRCEIVTRAAGSPRTASLRLERGSVKASLDPNERRRKRSVPGTTVYLLDLDPDVLRVLTQRKVVEYLRRRRGPALARGGYSIVVEEGRSTELVTPEEPDGVRLRIPAHPTLWGRIEFSLFVAPAPDRRRRVAVVGRAGTTILDDVAELEELDRPPWTTDQVSGQVAFDALQQTAGRRAILRDRSAFPVFVDALRAVEPVLTATLERVAREVDEQQADRLSDTIRRIFGRVLKELEDLDNPMRTLLGREEGEGAMALDGDGSPRGEGDRPPAPVPSTGLPDLSDPPSTTTSPPSGDAAAERGRSRALPTVAPDPDPGSARSRFDAESRLVLYNESHPDYLGLKEDEASLLDYLATLVAKEYVVYNNPRSAPEELAEEMVRMLVRVRRQVALVRPARRR